MIERDYIMRMIDLLSKVVARVLFLRKSLEFPKAAAELAAAARNLLGLDPQLIRLMSDTQLIDLLSADDSLSASKCYVLGMLLKEEAELLLVQEKHDEAAALLTKAVSLLLSAFLRERTPVVPSHQASLDEAIGALGNVRPATSLGLKLLEYFEHTGRYDKAENVLFELLDADPRNIQHGLLFYERLLTKTNDDLILGNLPRAEIEEAIRELNKRQNELR